MIRLFVVLALLAAGAELALRSLGTDRGTAPAPASAPLFTDAEREAWQGRLAALSVETGGERWLHGSVRGVWRALETPGVVTDPIALEAVIQALIDADGVPHATVGADDGARYGLAGPDAVTVRVHGADVLKPEADGDVLATVVAGRRAPWAGGVFARRPGSDAVWLIDTDPTAPLATARSLGLPPLADPRLVPADWTRSARGPRRIELERADGTGFALYLEPTGDASDEGEPIERWRLKERGEIVPVYPPGPLAQGYALYLQRAVVTRLLDPREAASHVEGGRASAVLRIEPVAGEPLELQLLGALSLGRRAVLDAEYGRLVEISRDTHRLAFPDVELLLEGLGGENPWDPFLR